MRVSTTLLRRMMVIVAIVASSLSIVNAASAGVIAITEWMYKNVDGPAEYFELTNISNAPVDLTGWSQDDSNGTVGKHSLTPLGVIQPGESVLGTDATDISAFRTYWGLSASVKIFNYTNDSLGSSDAINIWDSTGTLVDQLVYGASPSTSGVSGNIAPANLFANNSAAAVLSTVGDSYGSYRGGVSGSGDIGNPGSYVATPEPSSMALVLIGIAAMLIWRRRK